MELWLSMGLFALATSATPGPVNIVALSSATRHGIGPTLPFVAGAAVGFTLLLLLAGYGVQALLVRLPWLTDAIRLGGVLFLLYLALQLARDDGRLRAKDSAPRPSPVYGALLQWLSPKAWLAAVAGVGSYIGDGDRLLLWLFAGLYLVICFLSVAGWAVLGGWLRHQLNARRLRLFNRTMAALLALSAGYLLLSPGSVPG